MNKMNYREVFFTAVLAFGMAALLFGPNQPLKPSLEAGNTQVVSVEHSS
jgi:hypothetical protein